MESRLTIRHADSPFIQAVTSWVIGHDDTSLATPDGCWDLVVLKQAAKTSILLTGQTTTAVPLHFAPGDELMTISFTASAFLAFIPATTMLDRGIFLPKTGNHFRLASDVFEIPTFDNAEAFAQRLLYKGHLCQDQVVDALLRDSPPAYSSRSLQRRFLRATGMTQTSFRQIQRARQAADLLQRGTPAIDVAYELGYSDQSHLSRSIRRILGQTPTAIARLLRL
jgi:hypothetical protein